MTRYELTSIELKLKLELDDNVVLDLESGLNVPQPPAVERKTGPEKELHDGNSTLKEHDVVRVESKLFLQLRRRAERVVRKVVLLVRVR